jgi:Concanavalin A-like lectin/glucanases superfamily
MGLYDTTVLGYTPTLFYRQKETSGTAAADASTGSHAGTYTDNFTLNQSDSPITNDASARSVLWDGSDGWIATSYNPFSGNKTFMGWGKRTDQSAAHGFFGGSAASTSPCLYLGSGDASINWAPDMSSTVVTFDVSWPGGGGWHFIMLTFNNTTFDAICYVDGVKNGATKNPGVGYNASPGNFQWCGRGTFQYVWKGKLAEPAIVNGLLVGSDALAIYQAATSVGGGFNPAQGFWAA